MSVGRYINVVVFGGGEICCAVVFEYSATSHPRTGAHADNNNSNSRSSRSSSSSTFYIILAAANDPLQHPAIAAAPRINLVIALLRSRPWGHFSIVSRGGRYCATYFPRSASEAAYSVGTYFAHCFRRRGG